MNDNDNCLETFHFCINVDESLFRNVWSYGSKGNLTKKILNVLPAPIIKIRATVLHQQRWKRCVLQETHVCTQWRTKWRKIELYADENFAVTVIFLCGTPNADVVTRDLFSSTRCTFLNDRTCVYAFNRTNLTERPENTPSDWEREEIQTTYFISRPTPYAARLLPLVRPNRTTAEWPSSPSRARVGYTRARTRKTT